MRSWHRMSVKAKRPFGQDEKSFPMTQHQSCKIGFLLPRVSHKNWDQKDSPPRHLNTIPRSHPTSLVIRNLLSQICRIIQLDSDGQGLCLPGAWHKNAQVTIAAQRVNAKIGVSTTPSPIDRQQNVPGQECYTTMSSRQADVSTKKRFLNLETHLQTHLAYATALDSGMTYR